MQEQAEAETKRTEEERPSSLGPQDPKEDEDCRTPFLQLFILICCLGSFVLGLAQAFVDRHVSVSAVASISCTLATPGLFYISTRNRRSIRAPTSSDINSTSPDIDHCRELKLGLYAYSAFLDVVFTACILTDCGERDLYRCVRSD
jgi:hypothetical protein